MTYEIPNDIRSIELDNNKTKFDYFKSIVKEARNQENCYIAAFTAMIQMEEAANSKLLTAFDLENVQMNLHSLEDQIFQIRFDVNIVDTKYIFASLVMKPAHA